LSLVIRAAVPGVNAQMLPAHRDRERAATLVAVGIVAPKVGG
jgi:hypothetical protein